MPLLRQAGNSVQKVSIPRSAAIQRSGFWCENPVFKGETNEKIPKTTAQESFGPPPLLFDNKRRAKSHLATTSFAREGLTFSGDLPDYVTTQRHDYQKYPRAKGVIPACVKIEKTAFQRGLEGQFTLGSEPDPPIRPSDLEKVRRRDPLSYYSSKVPDPFVSVNQLTYQRPLRNVSLLVHHV
jgi:hypothetical protein